MRNKLILFLVLALFGSTTFLRANVLTVNDGSIITNPTPADGTMEVVAPVTLAWEGGEDAAQYKVLFGTVYPPVDNVEWTAMDSNYGTYTVEELDNNTQYFWQILVKDTDDAVVEGPVWGFTTKLTPPTEVEVTESQIFTDGSTVVKWRGSSTGGGFSGEITVADGTSTSSYIPVYGLWMDDYTLSEMIYPAEMLEEMEGGQITSMSFYISSPCASWAPATFNVFLMEVDNATMSSYYMPSNGQVVYTGAIDGSGTTMDIIFDTPYTYNGGNLLVGFEQLVEGTYHSCYFYGIQSTGSSASGYSSSSATAASFNQRDFLPKTTFVCGGKGTRSIKGYNVYYVNGTEAVKANTALITERQFTLENLPYNVNPGLDIHVTAVYDEGESAFDAGNVKVQVSGYATIHGTVTDLMSGEAIADATVKFFGKDEFENDVQYTTTTTSEGYTVTVAAGNYNRGTATAANYETGHMSAPVTVPYDEDVEVNFQLHEVYNPVYKVFAAEGDFLGNSVAEVIWSLNDFDDPHPNSGGGGGGGGGTGNASTFTEGFEGGMPAGWNVINANNDQVTWTLTSNITSTWTYYTTTPEWYRTGTNAICCGSFVNGIGAVNPDDYLVTPQVTLVNGSTFSFWAAAADEGYPAEHFGVFVSDNGTSDWTSVQEWTLTAKNSGNNGGPTSREGKGAKVGNWHNFSVDLSAYAGQKYIAIRNFNCYDQYIMIVDDIELTAGTKAALAFNPFVVSGKGFGPASNIDNKDGNWYYYDDGNNDGSIGTGGGSFWWGVMFPAGSYEGNLLTKVAVYDYMAMTGNVTIYQGGDTAPGTQVGQANLTFTGLEDYIEVPFDTPVTLDPTQNVWVIIYNGSGATYPAAYCSTANNANGRWISVDNSSWIDVASAVPSAGDFMVRAYIEGEGGGTVASSDLTYTLYRKALLTEGATSADSIMLQAGLVDTIYTDFTWADLEPGLYQYGVQAIYPTPGGKRNSREELTVHDGTATNGYVPVYGFYADAYLKSEMVYPSTELSDMVDGLITSMKFYSSTTNASWGAANFKVFMTEVADATINSFVGYDDATVVYEGALGITGGEMVVEFTTPYTYNGGNLLVGFYNTVTGTYVTSTWLGETISGTSVQGYSYTSLASITPSQRNFLPKTTFNYSAGAAGSHDNPVTEITWSNILPKDMATALTVSAIASTGSVEGATVTLTNLNENYNFNGTIDSTGAVVFEEFRKGEYLLTVALDGMISEYNETNVSIWNDTTIVAHFGEIFAPVDDFVVSSTGFARWTDMIPAATDVAERYIVNMNDALQGETTDNFMQLNTEDLTIGETYEAKVAVIYTTGMSPWKTASFTYLGCASVETQIDSMWYDPIEDGSMDITLNWTHSGGTGPTPPPTPPTGDVIVKLTAGDVWGDGSGYQMLLDDTHSLFGSTIPSTGALSTSCSGNDAIYAQFSHKIPTNADGNCTTSNIVINNSVEITIPAGTYDWCITNPTPGDRIWIAAANGNVGGRYDDYVFEGGHIYEFTVSMYGGNDGVDVTITGGKSMYQPNMGIMSLDNRTNSNFRGGNLGHAGVGFGNANSALTDDGNWYYYDNGVNEDAIGTGGGNFWWGVMFPAGSYEGNKLTKVAAYDYMAMTGTVTIYQGGNTAPGTSVGQTNVTFTGAEDFVEFNFAEPITLDPAQNVWVVFYNASGATYPAAVCANTGDANGRWVSLDGASWVDLMSYDLNNTFMVRAYIETGGGGGGGSTAVTYTPGMFNILVDGEVVGATSEDTYTITATDYDEHLYEVVYVDANYNISCPMGLVIRVPLTSVNSNEIVSSIYPNPTNGDLHVVAADMVRVSVLNTLGQILFDQAVKNDEIILNMARYEAGVYMINITTSNGSSVKRVVVTK